MESKSKVYNCYIITALLSVLQLAAVIEMLENAFYGLDLLKLHSVTTKLVGRVEKLEEVR